MDNGEVQYGMWNIRNIISSFVSKISFINLMSATDFLNDQNTMCRVNLTLHLQISDENMHQRKNLEGKHLNLLGKQCMIW